MFGRARTRPGDPSFVTAWTALKEATELFTVESCAGKISRLAMEIVDATQVSNKRQDTNREINAKSLSAVTTSAFAGFRRDLFAIIRKSCLKSRLLRVKPNNRAFNELVYDVCLLVSSLADPTRSTCKDSDPKPENGAAKLSPTSHLNALQTTLQAIRVFAQRRADEAIWKLYLSAKPDLGRIKGFREELDVYKRAQSNIAALETFEWKDPRADIRDGSRNGLVAVPCPSSGGIMLLPLDTKPRSASIPTRSPGLPSPTSLSCDDSASQLSSTVDADTSDMLRVDTLDDLRRTLSTTSGVNALLTLEKGPVVVQTVNLLQLEIRSARLDPNLSQYVKKCATCLGALVNKHHTLPTSLFVNDITKEGTQPCNWGGYSDIWKGRHGTHVVCLKVLRVHSQGRQRKEDKLVKANVLVDEHGHCLLADFGLATTVAESTTRAKSSTSEMKGSIRWMAPELFHSNNGIFATMGDGTERIDKFARDLYAFACTVLEVITGKPPFVELTDPKVMYEVMFNNARPSRPPSAIYWCPDNVWALIQRCWAQRSQDRPKASEVHGFLSTLWTLLYSPEPLLFISIMPGTFLQRSGRELDATSDAIDEVNVIKGFREELDVFKRAQSNITTLEAIEQKLKDPRAEIQSGSRIDLVALPCQSPSRISLLPLDIEPRSTPLLTRSSGLPSPTSSFCDAPVCQPASTADVNTKNPLRIETPGDLRRVLSTTSGVKALLALEDRQVVDQIVDLLQLEIRSARLDPGYLKECATCMEALVNKHQVLPASLFINDVTKEGTQPCNWGGFSDIWKGSHGTQAVCLKVLRVYAQGHQRKEDKLVKANVLVNEQSHCLLADFGLATTVAESTTRAKSNTSEMKGSIRWMAPELFSLNTSVPAMEGGKERINKFARDLYAFACTVLEVLSLVYIHCVFGHEFVEQVITGKPPFVELTDPKVMYEVMFNNARPSRPPSAIYWCPDNVWALIQRCWAQRSQDRPKASEVHGFLLKLVSFRNSGARWEDVSL
ncbi:hypothetical protein AAF712_003427 [Marasmius tenuissimus]|uniref:Protein kinase domain-containing protein n=1 Tax=Marasmius tenuissimus TaxID=585030 RepID=A0ABR3AA40_9AGAR